MRRLLDHPRRMAGFTLIEVMIAVIVFAIGLLTMASLQTVARKANYEAVQRTAAAHLAESLLERMRANPRALEDYIGPLGNRLIDAANVPAPGSACDSAAAPCTPAEMAGADIAQWWGLVNGNTESVANEAVGGLVIPTACVRGEIGGITGAYEVAIAWRGSGEMSGAPPDACGAANVAAYGGPGGFRRVLVVRSYINAL